MKIHRLQDEIVVPVPIEKAWRFFSDPRNLSKITPADMGFTVTSPDMPDEVYAGLVITYKVSPLAGLKLTWVTEITQVEKGVRFIDVQQYGPYSWWHHEHRFEEVPGGTKCTDLVHYAVPGWIFSGLVHALAVKPKLKQIFDFRKKVLEEIDWDAFKF